MSAGNDQLRTELDRKFQPPIDVLLDPSLLVANRSLERLADSTVFASQTQATLGRTPTEPRLGDLYVPATFHELLSSEEQSTVQKTDVWDFYRGQAEAAFPDDVVDLLDENDVETYSSETASDDLEWANVVDDPDRQERLLAILDEEFSFLHSGELVLSRTSAAFEAFRDAGVPTVDVGKAELAPEIRETLIDVGYQDPASVCAFGVSTAGSTTDALVGSVLAHPSDVLLYRVGD
ncbi:hypothetical protein Hbl1158_00480 [Halobaculum sp. CBA1158]|uniref:hypothetical protein n=1 Tax=Halobaculum sp. CBA1158 TaxID=2904243 RepID=UPI001F25292C|nr:hypothetical protein [Halobaculum sp. CBA1158]UIO99883.1 hypothetical protein Hbl1158_00480 [Halobaculum sp. CBA1158]